MEAKIVGLFLIALIGGSVGGFGLSYIIYQPQVQNLQTTAHATEITLEQEFNWNVGEIIDLQGNRYLNQGEELPNGGGGIMTLRLAEWQNGWITLTYAFGQYATLNVSLSPYIIEIKTIPDNVFFTCIFHSS